MTASSASAYKRTQTCDSTGTYACRPGETAKPIAWPVRCVQYRINKEGSAEFPRDPDGTIGDELIGLVRDAFGTWNKPNCTDFKLVEGALTSESKAQYKKDAGWTENLNVVVWRDNNWPYAMGTNTAFALTSVTYNSKDGVIADADIEINSDTYDFTHLNKGQPGKTSKVDLLNTLTHEIGHFVGLDHPNLPAATMYGMAPTGEVKKRTLHQDDINGLCAIYPGKTGDGHCDYPDDFVPPEEEEKTKKKGGCSCSTADAPRLPVLLVGVVIFAAGLRRRRVKRNHGPSETD